MTLLRMRSEDPADSARGQRIGSIGGARTCGSTPAPRCGSASSSDAHASAASCATSRSSRAPSRLARPTSMSPASSLGERRQLDRAPAGPVRREGDKASGYAAWFSPQSSMNAEVQPSGRAERESQPGPPPDRHRSPPRQPRSRTPRSTVASASDGRPASSPARARWTSQSCPGTPDRPSEDRVDPARIVRLHEPADECATASARRRGSKAEEPATRPTRPAAAAPSRKARPPACRRAGTPPQGAVT